MGCHRYLGYGTGEAGTVAGHGVSSGLPLVVLMSSFNSSYVLRDSWPGGEGNCWQGIGKECINSGLAKKKNSCFVLLTESSGETYDESVPVPVSTGMLNHYFRVNPVWI
jgi:hypothetical protein